MAMLLALVPCGHAEPEDGSPSRAEEDATATRALPTTTVRPSARPRTLPPPPQITSFSPTREIIAGGTIIFRGRDLRPEDFVARLGTLRPVALKVLRSTSTEVRVHVPESAITQGSPLTVAYAGGQPATLADNFKVYPRPKFSNLVVRTGPRIGAPTDMDVTVSNFAGLEGAELTVWSNCRTHGFRSGSLPAAATSATIRLSIPFRMSEPALGPTEELMAVSGKRCDLSVTFRKNGQIEPRIATGLSVQLPAIAKYTVENTWELQGFSTPSGKTFKASVAGFPGACGPLSLGTAGTFPVGVVNYQNDISFQLRNGLANVSCEFTTSPRLQVKDGWQITEVDWATWASAGNHCRAQIEHVEWAPGHWGQDPNLNPEYLDRIKTVVGCVVDTQDRARNSHLFRAVLRKIVLVGPPGQSWRAAFR